MSSMVQIVGFVIIIAIWLIFSLFLARQQRLLLTEEEKQARPFSRVFRIMAVIIGGAMVAGMLIYRFVP